MSQSARAVRWSSGDRWPRMAQRFPWKHNRSALQNSASHRARHMTSRFNRRSAANCECACICATSKRKPSRVSTLGNLESHSLDAEEPMERSVDVLALILFGIVGLSHILQPKAWVQFFILLRGKGEAGAFVDGFLNLPLGALIVGFHNVWSGIPLVLTLVGWGLLIKSLIRFCAPKQALRIMTRVSLERSWEFQLAGAFLVTLACLLGYRVYAG